MDEEKLRKLFGQMLKSWRAFKKSAEAYRMALLERKDKTPIPGLFTESAGNPTEFITSFTKREAYYGDREQRKPYKDL